MRGYFASTVLFGSLLFAGFADAQTGTSPGKSPAPAPAPKAQIQPGAAAPEFPPGIFTDGGHYTMDDFKGKVLALYFFELG